MLDNKGLEILSDWKNGDLDRAVEQHNALWEVQGGDTGKTNRLLPAEEEESYIIRYYQSISTKYYSPVNSK